MPRTRRKAVDTEIRIDQKNNHEIGIADANRPEANEMTAETIVETTTGNFEEMRSGIVRVRIKTETKFAAAVTTVSEMKRFKQEISEIMNAIREISTFSEFNESV